MKKEKIRKKSKHNRMKRITLKPPASDTSPSSTEKEETKDHKTQTNRMPVKHVQTNGIPHTTRGTQNSPTNIFTIATSPIKHTTSSGITQYSRQTSPELIQTTRGTQNSPTNIFTSATSPIKHATSSGVTQYSRQTLPEVIHIGTSLTPESRMTFVDESSQTTPPPRRLSPIHSFSQTSPAYAILLNSHSSDDKAVSDEEEHITLSQLSKLYDTNNAVPSLPSKKSRSPERDTESNNSVLFTPTSPKLRVSKTQRRSLTPSSPRQEHIRIISSTDSTPEIVCHSTPVINSHVIMDITNENTPRASHLVSSPSNSSKSELLEPTYNQPIGHEYPKSASPRVGHVVHTVRGSVLKKINEKTRTQSLSSLSCKED